MPATTYLYAVDSFLWTPTAAEDLDN